LILKQWGWKLCAFDNKYWDVIVEHLRMWRLATSYQLC
jgi:hypothetical protein